MFLDYLLSEDRAPALQLLGLGLMADEEVELDVESGDLVFGFGEFPTHLVNVVIKLPGMDIIFLLEK